MFPVLSVFCVQITLAIEAMILWLICTSELSVLATALFCLLITAIDRAMHMIVYAFECYGRRSNLRYVAMLWHYDLV